MRKQERLVGMDYIVFKRKSRNAGFCFEYNFGLLSEFLISCSETNLSEHGAVTKGDALTKAP